MRGEPVEGENRDARLQALASELKFKDIRVFLAIGTRRPAVYNVGRYFSAVLHGEVSTCFEVDTCYFEVVRSEVLRDTRRPRPDAYGSQVEVQVRALHPGERIHTFWKYFPNAFARNAGLRIDHLLLSPSLAGRLVAAGVERDVRARDHASDHAPVWIELAYQRHITAPGATRGEG